MLVVVVDIPRRHGPQSPRHHTVTFCKHEPARRPHQTPNTMTTLPRVFIEPTAGTLLFMHWDSAADGWVPHLETMEGWQHCSTRIYQIGPTQWITITSGDKYSYRSQIVQRWGILRRDEEVDIKAVLDHPWIEPRQVFTTIPEEVVQDFDTVLEDRLLNEEDSPYWNHPLMRLLDGAPPMGFPIPRPFTMIPVPSAPRGDVGSSKTPEPQSSRLPVHVVNLLIQQAVASQQRCPITMELLVPRGTAVTTCGHLFDAEAIRQWFTTRQTCPTCRQPAGL